MELITTEVAYEKLKAFQKDRAYRAMYSSIFEGTVTQPDLMIIPIDDHMVHRGDGIFEALRFSSKGVFLFNEHIDRLFVSADYISLNMPWDKSEIKALCEAVIQASKLVVGQLRLFISRGPGDFSPNPYSTVGSQLFIVAMPFKKMDQKFYEEGAKLLISDSAIKPGIFPKIKSCNYLPNVLMKKEAIDKKVDFVVNKSADSYIAEGPTENIMILDKDNNLIAPDFDYTLRGTTLLKTLQIAEKLKAELSLNSIGLQNIREKDLLEAKEIMMVGTTLGVLPVTEVNGQTRGQVGPVSRKLHQELEKLI